MVFPLFTWVWRYWYENALSERDVIERWNRNAVSAPSAGTLFQAHHHGIREIFVRKPFRQKHCTFTTAPQRFTAGFCCTMRRLVPPMRITNQNLITLRFVSIRNTAHHFWQRFFFARAVWLILKHSSWFEKSHFKISRISISPNRSASRKEFCGFGAWRSCTFCIWNQSSFSLVEGEGRCLSRTTIRHSQQLDHAHWLAG